MLAIAVASCAILQADDAVASLGQVKMFAFGGIGVAGTPSQGQQLFNRVLDSPDALKHFNGIMKSGNAAGKLYALCGLKALDKAAYNTALASLKTDKTTTVETAAGCMISHQPVASIVKNIEDGHFDHYFSKKRSE